MPIDSRIPQCNFIKSDGRQCGSPALRGHRFCYYHYEVNRPTVCLDVPPLEDANAIQVALNDIARAVAEDRIDLKRATVLTYVLQTAASNLKRVQFGVFKDSMVREFPEQDPYFRGVHSERGDEAQRQEEAAYAAGPDRPQPQPAASGKPETRKLKSGT
jgi:hypothetical protein